MNASLLVTVALILVHQSLADDHNNNIFIYPTAPGPSNNYVANLVFSLGSIQKIQWIANISSYSVVLYQQYLNSSAGPIETISGRSILFWSFVEHTDPST